MYVETGLTGQETILSSKEYQMEGKSSVSEHSTTHI